MGKKLFMHIEGLLIINKPKIHWASYFEMSMIHYFQVLIRHKICPLTTIYNILLYKPYVFYV